jgi:hypothetical protein
MLKRVPRRQDTNGATPTRHHVLHGPVERILPGTRFAVNQRCGQREVPCPAKYKFGGCNQPTGQLTQPVEPIFPDAYNR